MSDDNTVRVHICERTGTKNRTWKITVNGTQIADLKQPLDHPASEDGLVTRHLAERFGVPESAIEYVPGGRSRAARRRLVPAWAVITLPPAKPEPVTCGHQPGELACELPGCHGTPPIDEPMDRDRTPVARDAEPGRTETGEVTSAREILRAVATSTGLHVSDGVVANNGWADTRPGRRAVNGLAFTVDRSIDVRVLSYEGQPGGWFAAVYVGGSLVQATVDLERPGPEWQHTIAQAIARESERLHDKRLLAVDIDDACLLLKDPPVGFVVDVPDLGFVHVAEASTNDGMTLRVTGPDGQFRFIDRRSAGVWLAHRPKRDCSYTGCAGKHCWCGAALTGPSAALGLAGGVCRRDPQHQQDRPPVGFTAGRYDHDDHSGALTHVVATSPTTVELGGGREGLVNPTWCGLVRLPDGDRGWHPIGLDAATITCPVCHHLLTCPDAAQVGDGEPSCPVCKHLDGCDDTSCVLAHHPGLVPAPGQTAEVVADPDDAGALWGDLIASMGTQP